MHDDFINDGPIVVGVSVRRKESSENQKRNDQDTKKKKRPPEAPSFEDLLKLAAKVKLHMQSILFDSTGFAVLSTKSDEITSVKHIIYIEG